MTRLRLRSTLFPYTTLFRSPPFSGHVASIEVVPGQWVSAGDELMTIIELDQIKVEVQVRSEEHTSELQSRPHLVCRLLLEKKNTHPIPEIISKIIRKRSISR